jgi:hypothetical protein
MSLPLRGQCRRHIAYDIADTAYFAAGQSIVFRRYHHNMHNSQTAFR